MDHKISTPLSHRCHFLKSYTLNFSLLLFPLRGKTASTTTLQLARARAVSMEQPVQESEDSQATGREPACYDFEVARSFLPSSSSTRYEHGGKDRGKKRKEEEWIWSEGGKDPSRTRARDEIYVETEHVAAIITRPSHQSRKIGLETRTFATRSERESTGGLNLHADQPLARKPAIAIIP